MIAKAGFDSTLAWIRFEFPTHSIDRLKFEKTLKQIRSINPVSPERKVPTSFKEAA